MTNNTCRGNLAGCSYYFNSDTSTITTATTTDTSTSKTDTEMESSSMITFSVSLFVGCLIYLWIIQNANDDNRFYFNLNISDLRVFYQHLDIYKR